MADMVYFNGNDKGKKHAWQFITIITAVIVTTKLIYTDQR